MKTVVWSLRAMLFAAAGSCLLLAQQAAPKHFLKGTVESVDAGAKLLSVHNEAVAGWMGEMTMAYRVDPPSVLAQVKTGDRITANVYEGDLTLHDVVILPRASADAAASGLNLETLEGLAVAGNPTVAQAEASLRSAEAMTKQASLYPNPTFGYYSDEVRGGVAGGGKQGVFLSQNIVMGGKLRAAKTAADLESQAVRAGVEVRKQRLLNGVRIVFYQTLAAQRLVELREDTAQLAADFLQTTRQLANVGQADRPDILQAEVEWQQARVGASIAHQSLQAAWRVLATLIGKPGMAVERLAGNLDAYPELNYDEQLAMALRDSPEIAVARKTVERQDATLTVERKAPIPDLQFSGTLAQNNELLESTGRPTGLMGGVQVGVQLPVFNRNQGKIDAAKADVEGARQELNEVQMQIARRIAEAFRDYDAARTTATQYKAEILPRAEEAYKLYQQSYQKMAGAYSPVLISQRTLFQLRAEYLEALAAVWSNAVKLQGFGLVYGTGD